jgi:hypothetical protein
MAALADLVKERNPGAVSKDKLMVMPGRMFHVEESEKRLEFGSDRVGDPGKDRPALMFRQWKDHIWFALPGSWVDSTDPGKYLIRPQDWASYRRPGAPIDQYVVYWYESVNSDWLYNPVGDVNSACFESIRDWVIARHFKHPNRTRVLEGEGSTPN